MTTAQAILMVGFVCGAALLMAVAWFKDIQAFAYGAAGIWMMAAGVSYSVSAGVWDLYFFMGWICVGLMITSGVEGLAIRGKAEQKADQIDAVEEKRRAEMLDKRESFDDYREKHGMRPVRGKSKEDREFERVMRSGR